MILDSVRSFEKYRTLQEGFDKVYQFIKKNDLHALEEGKYEIDGEKVYCTVWKGPAKGLEPPKLEVHDSHIDIHVLLEGSETMGIKDRRRCSSEDREYDEATDTAFLSGEPENYVVLGTDNLAIVFPADAHAPLMGEGEIKKAIFKVWIPIPSAK